MRAWLSIGIAVMIGCAASAASAKTASAKTAKSHHLRHPPPVAAPHQIACTVLGCIPVPPACDQTYGRTLNGIPTGYDVIVCPPGVWPLK